MSRDSRDGKHSHHSDDGRRNDSADLNDRNEERTEDDSADSERVHRHDRPHGSSHLPSDAEGRERPHHAHHDSARDEDGSSDRRDGGDRDEDDRDEDSSQRRSEHSSREHASNGHAPHHRAYESADEHHAKHAPDPAKFASYDEEEVDDLPANRDSARHAHRHKEYAESSHYGDPPRRPHADFRTSAVRDATVASYGQTTTTTRRAADANGAALSDPAAVNPRLTDPMVSPLPSGGAAPYGAANGLHPYDHHRATLIGLSTALVAAIVIIVAMMSKFSSHPELAPALKQEYETKLTTYQQNWQDAQTLADQRARDAQQAADLAARNQQLAQTNAQAYQAAQDELRRKQTAVQQIQQQYQQQGQVQQAENEQRLYVTQIRLAKQAWDRGDTNQVLQLLEPYRSDPARQKFRSFAWYYLWQAAHNSGSNTLKGHGDVVRQVVVTPDGSQIISLADDGQMIVWDAALGRKLSAVTLERNVPPRSAGVIVEDQLARRASGLVVADNGAWAAAYGRDLFVGANIRRPSDARLVNDHASPIISLAISRDGRKLVSGDYAGNIVVRNSLDGSVLRRFQRAEPLSLALSTDGALLFAGMHDGALFVWDTSSGNMLGTRAFGDGINSMAISPDGSAVALALGVRDGVVRVWEPATGRFRGDLRGHHDEVTHVVWSRDGKSLLTSSRDQTACLWSNTGALLRTFRGHLGDVEDAVFSPDGQKVVTASDDMTLILWNVDGGQACDMLTDTPVDGWVSGLAFTPDGSQLIGTGSCDGAGDSYEAYLTDWNLADNARPIPLQTSSRSGVALAFSPDGRQMAVGESSPPESTVKSRVRIWSIDPPRVLGTVPKLPGSVYSVAYSSDGRLLAIGTGDVDERTPGTTLIVEGATGALRQKLPNLPGKVQAMFTADGHYLITVNSSKRRAAEVRIWDPQTAQMVAQIENPTELAGLITATLSPDGRYLVTGHGDPANPGAADKAKIKVWDLSTRQLVGMFPAAHSAAITNIAFTRRGVLMASGDMAGNVRIWDFASRRLTPKQIPSQGRAITHLDFDRSGERIAVASDEKCVRVWHIDSGQQLAIMELSLGVPNVVGYTLDGKLLAGATSAGGLYLWDADTYKPRAVLRGEGNPAGQQGHGGVVTCVAPLLADKLFTGSNDKTVRVWDLKTHKPIAVAFPFNEAVSCMAISRDNHWLAVGTGKYRSKFETGQLVLCDASNHQQPLVISQNITPTSVAFSPDGNLLAVCSLSSAVGQAARTVSLVDVRTGHASPINSPMGHSVAFSPDGRVLAVGCTNGEIDLWPLDAQSATKPFVVKKHQGLVWSLAFSPDGKTLASGSADNNVVIWDLATGEDLMTLKHNGSIESLLFSPDGRILATAAHEPARGSVCLWRAPADEDAPTNSLRGPSGPAFDRAASPDAATPARSTYADSSTSPVPAGGASYGRRASRSSPGGYSQPAADPYAQPGAMQPVTQPISQPVDSYSQPIAQPAAQPINQPVDPSAPLPLGDASGNASSGDDRYSAAPLPTQNFAAPDSSYNGASGDPSQSIGPSGGQRHGGHRGQQNSQPMPGP